VVDALDELSDICCNCLVEECFQLQKRHGVSLFFTSRSLPEITGKFGGKISLELRAHRKDVERYMDDRIRHSSPPVQELKDEIKTTISDVVDGMYV